MTNQETPEKWWKIDPKSSLLPSTREKIRRLRQEHDILYRLTPDKFDFVVRKTLEEHPDIAKTKDDASVKRASIIMLANDEALIQRDVAEERILINKRIGLKIADMGLERVSVEPCSDKGCVYLVFGYLGRFGVNATERARVQRQNSIGMAVKSRILVELLIKELGLDNGHGEWLVGIEEVKSDYTIGQLKCAIIKKY